MTKADYEIKLKESIEKCKKKYEDLLAKKKCVKMISINEKPQIIEQPAKQQPTIQYCKATKMDGQKCTAKAKTGCGGFCGRHCKI
jgi:hypothetical protein